MCSGSPQMCYCGIGSLIHTDHYVNHATSELSSYLTTLLLSGGRCEDMRDFIWLPRSYLINSWIQSRILAELQQQHSTGNRARARPGYSPGHQTVRKGVSGPGTNQRPVWPALTNQRPVSRGECLHCRGSAEPAPTHPCLSLSCTPVNTCQKQLARTQTESNVTIM